MERPEYAVFLGLDVGKEELHACGVDPTGKRVHDKPLPQAEDKLREILQAFLGGVVCWSWSTSRPRSARWR